MIQRLKYLLLAALALCAFAAQGQKVGVKTNLLYDATATVNLGLEVGLAPKWTLDISGNLNAWNINNHRWRHWMVQPEVRYWLCERFQGNFFAFHLIGGQYNWGNLKGWHKFLGSDFSELADYRFQGWAAGAGLGFGHAWVLGSHWNIEAEIGLGWLYTRYDRYPCTECGSKDKDNKPHNYVGPTKAALSVVYLF